MPTSKEWREFELLVARIERTLGPLGAHVESPGRVKDRLTGQMREVDVAIRYRIGTVDILITVECRRRDDKQDVTWIEEIAGKRDSVGAARTVAVSAEGFTRPAIESAAKRGIEIRMLAEVSEQDIQGWLRIAGVILHVVRPRLRDFHITLWERPGHVRPEVHPDVCATIKAHGAGAPVFAWRESLDTPNVSVNTLLSQITRLPRWSDGIPQDGTPTRKVVELDPRGQLLVRAVGGAMVEVAALSLAFDLALETYHRPTGDRMFRSYEAPGEHLVQHSSCSVGLGGTKLSLEIVRDMRTNLMHIALSQSELDALGEKLKRGPLGPPDG
jgi:hypothetical protein